MKERYITMRNSNQLDLGLLYTLACDEGLTSPFDHFAMAMSFANIHQIMDHLDSKFELTKLFGKDGNFIKVINNE
jgi:hypothetical protein